MPRISNRPSNTELVENLEDLTTRSEVEAYLRESLFEDREPIANKNHLTQYSKTIDKEIDASLLPPELQYTVDSKRGQITKHYAVKVLRDIQRELTEGTKPTIEQKSENFEKYAKHSIDAPRIIEAAKAGIRSGRWRVMLVSLCLLTGRRIGAVAFETSFEIENKALLRVTSGQKKRGEISSIVIPALDDAEAIVEGIQEVRNAVRIAHELPYQRWLADPSVENGHKFTNSLTGSKLIRDAFESTLKPLFNNHPMSRIHDLRGIYGAIIYHCHLKEADSTNPASFVQKVLDHESSATTNDYMKFKLKGIDRVLEEAPQEFVTAMHSATYQSKAKSFPINLDALLGAISNEHAKAEIASLLHQSEKEKTDYLSGKLGFYFNRSFELTQSLKASENSTAASVQIERLVRAIMDYNQTQEGSPEDQRAYVRVTVPLLNTVGKTIYGKTFDSKTAQRIIGGKDEYGTMTADLEAHYKTLNIPENQNLFYRRSNKIEEIVQDIASQHG